jgi:hypothetical protein
MAESKESSLAILVLDISKDLLLNHNHSRYRTAAARTTTLSCSEGATMDNRTIKSEIELNCARDPISLLVFEEQNVTSKEARLTRKPE